MNVYHVLGIMSGSSLDGLDIAHCEIQLDSTPTYKIHDCICIPFTDSLVKELRHAKELGLSDFHKLDAAFGEQVGIKAKEFMLDRNIQQKIDFIAWHGHTVLHQPELKISKAIGHGAQLAEAAQKTVVCEFRSADIANGGQGAPLAPIIDLHLFPEFKFCLNLGGIANLSVKKEDSIIGFDVCVANQALNHYANQLGKEFDDNGDLAKSGKPIQKLLRELNQLPFYQKEAPKSLSNQYLLNHIIPLSDSYTESIPDILHSLVEHIAEQVSLSIDTFMPNESDKILVSGGGAHNKFLMETLQSKCRLTVKTPNKKLVNFKESLLMAYCGALRWNKLPNSLSSVTGASKDSVGGTIYLA